MDTFLALASVRVVRQYSSRSIGPEALGRILQAGRVTGSSQNRQQWKFYVVTARIPLDELAHTVYEPDNLLGCGVAIGVATAGGGSFDAGRCVQNIILAAWDQGIGSCPNGIHDADAVRRLLGVAEGETVSTLLSLGYPARPSRPGPGGVDGLLQRIKRKPLDELVVWVQ